MTFDVSNIDSGFDDFFVACEGMNWWPWVGKDFRESKCKTLILGESTYNWNPDDVKVLERISDKNHLRVLHQKHALNYDRSSPFVRNIEWALFNSRLPTREQKPGLWSSVTVQLYGRRVKIVFIRHPSVFFRWKEWNAALKNQMVMPAD